MAQRLRLSGGSTPSSAPSANERSTPFVKDSSLAVCGAGAQHLKRFTARRVAMAESRTGKILFGAAVAAAAVAAGVDF